MDQALKYTAIVALCTTLAALAAVTLQQRSLAPEAINEAALPVDAPAPTRIELSEADGSVRAVDKRSDGSWILSDSGYAADRVPQLLDALNALRLGALKTARSENFAPLQVAETGKPGAGRRLRVLSGDRVLLDVMLGKVLPARRSDNGAPVLSSRFFVRRSDSPQVRLAHAPLPPTQWRLRPDQTSPLPPVEFLRARDPGVSATCLAALTGFSFDSVRLRTPPPPASATEERRIELTDTRTQALIVVHRYADALAFDGVPGSAERFVYVVAPEQLKGC